jgi:uncharacterized protein (DUF1778 family)
MTRRKITDPDLKRTESLRVRVSPSELKTIREAADKNKMTVSELLRALVIEFHRYQK